MSRTMATKPEDMRRLFDRTLAEDPVLAKATQAVIAENALKTVDAHLHFLRFKGRKVRECVKACNKTNVWKFF
jgi:hypothetical protein